MANPVREAIVEECNAIANLLLTKNAAYGNSVFNPIRIFSKGDWLDMVNARIDDKLSRIARGTAGGEDAELDLIGYLILKRVGLRLQAKATQ